MTREVALSHVAPNLSYFNDCKPAFAIGEYKKWVNKIYDDFEQELQIATSDKTCTGCIHEPKTEKDNYAEECGFCKRFFGDGFEKKRIKKTRSQGEDYPKC